MRPKEENYSKSKRLKNQIKAVVTNPYNVIVLIAILLLTYLIVLPLLDMISSTFELAQRDLRAVGGDAVAGQFTLYYWKRLLASELSMSMLIKPLINSLTIGVCVSVCAIALGSVLAWLMVRSDLPCKPFFSLAVIIPYMIPSWCKSQAWLSMFKTARLGGAPGFMASLGFNVPDWLAYGPVAIIIAIAITGWMDSARVVRGRMLQFKNREFVLAASTLGASPIRIIFRHILPNILGQQVVNISSAIPAAIFLEAYLSFIGLGIKSPMTSWGQLCQVGSEFYRLYPYQLFIPGVFISVTILAFYLFGNCLRDALDPHLRD